MAEIVDKPVGFMKKHKTGVLAGAGILAIFVIYIILKGSGAGGGSNAPADSSAITDPNAATGFNPANGLVQGPPGMAGAPGPSGPRGPGGSTKFSFWREARALLIARGNKHPSQAQINRERDKLIKNADKPSGGQHMHPGVEAPVSPAVNLAANTTHYTVKPGDTAQSIALKHGIMDPSSVHGANRTVMGHKDVMAGQRVRVR